MREITVKNVEMHAVSLPLVEPLRTSFGLEANKVAVLIKVETEDGIIGWGEASVELGPGYGSETVGTAMHIIKNFIIPRLTSKRIDRGTDVPYLLRMIRGNRHTKAGVEAAIWDALAKTNDMRLADYFAAHLPDGHTPRAGAPVGVSIGLQPTIQDTLDIINKRLSQGYERIKLKVQPKGDMTLVAGVRAALPDIMLMVDANSAYSLDDLEHLKQFDNYGLVMIEQPLAYDDIYEHSLLQKAINTPICLDESVKSASDLQVALALDACRILNLKPARVGGYSESLKIYQICVEKKLPLWVGGTLETGIGRAANLAFASLPGVTYPCDISATDRYFDPDITEPPFTLNDNATISLPDGAGIDVEVIPERLEEAKLRWGSNYPYAASY